MCISWSQKEKGRAGLLIIPATQALCDPPAQSPEEKCNHQKPKPAKPVFTVKADFILRQANLTNLSMFHGSIYSSWIRCNSGHLKAALQIPSEWSCHLQICQSCIQPISSVASLSLYWLAPRHYSRAYYDPQSWSLPFLVRLWQLPRHHNRANYAPQSQSSKVALSRCLGAVRQPW